MKKKSILSQAESELMLSPLSFTFCFVNSVKFGQDISLYLFLLNKIDTFKFSRVSCCIFENSLALKYLRPFPN